VKEEVQSWIKQADHDLKMAEGNLQMEGYDVCLVLCQQAIEKYLKALYIQEKNEFPPRTHSFKRLVDLLGLSQEFLESIIEVEKYYSILRYPDITDKMPYENCIKEDAQMGLEKAKEVKLTIIGKLA